MGGGGLLSPFVGAGSGLLLPCMGPLSSFMGAGSWGGAGPCLPFVGWYWAVVIVHGVVLGCCRRLWAPFCGWWCWAVFAICGVVLGRCPLCCCLLVTLGGLGWEDSPFVALKMANDERQFHHCSSSGCHIAVSDMAPGSHVNVSKGDMDRLTHCRRRQCRASSPSDNTAFSSLCPMGLADDGGDVEGCG